MSKKARELGKKCRARARTWDEVTAGMIRWVFRLRFKGQAVLTAQTSARDKTEDAPVLYSGPVERLPLLLKNASAVELKACFRSFARELHATLEIEEIDDRTLPWLDLDETLAHLMTVGRRRQARGPSRMRQERQVEPSRATTTPKVKTLPDAG